MGLGYYGRPVKRRRIASVRPRGTSRMRTPGGPSAIYSTTGDITLAITIESVIMASGAATGGNVVAMVRPSSVRWR